MPLVHSDCARLAAVKWAEKDASVILRLCEFRGKGGAVEIELPGWVKQAWQVNLLEREEEALSVENQAVKLNLRPWEIATLKLNL